MRIEPLYKVLTLYVSACSMLSACTYTLIWCSCKIVMQGYVSRSCVWDNENLILPSDTGTLVWWSVSGRKLFQEKVASSDYIVHLEWSVSGKALWMCGFSTLSYVEVKKNHDGKCTCAHMYMQIVQCHL